MDPLFVAYLTFTAVLVLTPGSTTAVVVRNALHGGRRAGVGAAVGAAIANTSHATFAGLGMTVVIARWPAALTALRVAGGIYLAWLGLRSIRRAIKFPDGGVPLAPERTQDATDSLRLGSVRQGVAVNLLNPAIATFYLVAVPSFIPIHAPVWYFAFLASIHVALAFTCHVLWATALGRVRGLLHRPGAQHLLEAGTGIALLALAGRVLTQ